MASNLYTRSSRKQGRKITKYVKWESVPELKDVRVQAERAQDTLHDQGERHRPSPVKLQNLGGQRKTPSASREEKETSHKGLRAWHETFLWQHRDRDVGGEFLPLKLGTKMTFNLKLHIQPIDQVIKPQLSSMHPFLGSYCTMYSTKTRKQTTEEGGHGGSNKHEGKRFYICAQKYHGFESPVILIFSQW